LLVPLLGGSGGGGQTDGFGGSGGGGAILIAANTRISLSFDSSVRARGGLSNGSFNEGSGGAVRFVAPLVQGNGEIDLTGGNRGAAGRLRVDTIDRTQIQFRTPGVAGALSVGGFLTVFPPNNPRLDIIAAAGTTIPEGTNCTGHNHSALRFRHQPHRDRAGA
jgi:hypothetical protein